MQQPADSASLLPRYLNILDERGLYSSSGNFRHYTGYLFDGVPLLGKRFIDVGGGNGIYSFFAHASGAAEAICLEPEGDGSTSGVSGQFREIKEALGNSPTIRLESNTLGGFERENGSLDVILLNNSINHLDEDACIVLHKDPAARKRYLQELSRLSDWCAPGGKLVVTDCSRYNFFALLGVENPVIPGIEWEKHQSPQFWAGLLAEIGFRNPRIRWSSFNRLRGVGRAFLGNPVAAYFLASHFCLTMDKPS